MLPANDNDNDLIIILMELLNYSVGIQGLLKKTDPVFS